MSTQTANEQKAPEVNLNLTEEQLNHHLEELVFKFDTEYSFNIFGKTPVIIAILNNTSQLEVEDEMKDVVGSTSYIVHHYQLKILSRTLRQYNETKFNSPAEVIEFVKILPSTVLDTIISHQNAFEKAIMDAAKSKHFKNLS